MISFFNSRLCAVHCALRILESAINFKIQTPEKRKINEKKRGREILAAKFNTFGAATTTTTTTKELINSFDEMIKIKSLRTLIVVF